MRDDMKLAAKLDGIQVVLFGGLHLIVHEERVFESQVFIVNFDVFP